MERETFLGFWAVLPSNLERDAWPPASAASMAISCGWPRLVVPALLAGLWGYVIGTPIGVMVVEFFKR